MGSRGRSPRKLRGLSRPGARERHSKKKGGGGTNKKGGKGAPTKGDLKPKIHNMNLKTLVCTPTL